MTRLEFEAYEKRVEAVLASVEQRLDATERDDFNEVASAAREVVDIRREHLELTERQDDREGRPTSDSSYDDRCEDPSVEWNAAVARSGLEAVDGNNQYIREATQSNEELQCMIDQIELSRAE